MPPLSRLKKDFNMYCARPLLTKPLSWRFFRGRVLRRLQSDNREWNRRINHSGGAAYLHRSHGC